MHRPLADEIRPLELDDVVGQKHILGPGGLLRRVIDSGDIPNMVFYGPSGTGKTTVANIIARKTERSLRRLNATNAGLADIKAIIAELDTMLTPGGVLLYLDEIQYFNKKQQQSLLEFIEDGRITLIASTTENPYFYVYNALLSRSTLPEVKAVGRGCGPPHDRGNNNTCQYGADRMVSFQVFIGDSTYFRMLGLERLRDNHVADADGSAASWDFWASNVWYINQYALRELGIAEDAPDFKVGENLSQPIVIAGIYRDFQIGTALDAPTGALLRVVKDSDGFQPWNILVKTRGDHAAAYRAVEELFRQTTDGASFSARYLTDEIADDFAAQRRLLHIIGLFTLVALLISSLGLFAMAAYYIQQKRQEIAVRRVFGASRREMLTRLVRSFMALVGVAFVIAVPIAVWGLRRWLEEYSVRIALSPWIFLAAGLFAAVVALLSVGWQSRRAADADPVESLKN